jgi:hypothetical protein
MSSTREDTIHPRIDPAARKTPALAKPTITRGRPPEVGAEEGFPGARGGGGEDEDADADAEASGAVSRNILRVSL